MVVNKMERVHFLNVKNGDCSWIQHTSGRNTVIDICNGNALSNEELNERKDTLKEVVLDALMTPNFSGNFKCKQFPTNPLEYFEKHEMPRDIFRFILTHPDMDHMDGLSKLIEKYNIVNFWDTDNDKKIDLKSFSNMYNKNDWITYQNSRINKRGPKVLNLYNGDQGSEYTNDGLEILSPTQELIEYANAHDDYNTSSYVILYTTTTGRKILFCGDSDEIAWNSIASLYEEKIRDVDILIASHHGRKSGGCSAYLDILKPKLTLFGNASSEHLDYSSWNNRKLWHITNNQAGNVVLNFNKVGCINVYVENRSFAEKYNQYRYYSKYSEVYFVKSI